MLKAFLLLISLALFDSIDPFPTSATIFLFGRKNGDRSARRYLLAAMGLYTTFGLVFYYLIRFHVATNFGGPNGFFQLVLARGINYLNTNLSYIIQILIGMVLIGWAIWQYLYGRRNARRELNVLKETAPRGIIKIVAAGAAFYLPSAIPFMVSITALITTGVPMPLAIFGIVLYVVLYMTFPITLNILHIILGAKSEPRIEKIRLFIARFGSVIVAVIMVVLGLALIANAIYFFTNNGQSILLQLFFHKYLR